MKRGLLLFILLSLFMPRLEAADYFVSTSAKPGGDGSIDKPFATIIAGLAVAQPGDRVLLRGGEYRVSEHRDNTDPDKHGSLRFPRPGRERAPITLAAYQNEDVILLGSVQLTDWTLHKGNIWKAKPPRYVKALYENGIRLTHPRVRAKRADPDISALDGPGTWTQAKGWVYLWARNGESPAKQRIEASQTWIVDLNKRWTRLEGLRLFYGQPICVNIAADHCEVVNCEIAHCANSVDNSYAAYFARCSNSAIRNSRVHDSYYWGEHGSNSHLVSSITCGGRGPNIVDNCVIFNGGIGVGNKGGTQNLIVTNCDIRQTLNGIKVSGIRKRVEVPGGNYVIYGNRIRDCNRGIWMADGTSKNNQIYNNLIQDCGLGYAVRNTYGFPQNTKIANNLFVTCWTAMEFTAREKGKEKKINLDKYVRSDFRSDYNMFDQNKQDYSNEIGWGKRINLTLEKLRAKKELSGDPNVHLEGNSSAVTAVLDRHGRPLPKSPTIGAGKALPASLHYTQQKTWNVGLPSWKEGEEPDTGLLLSIKGSASKVASGPIALRASLVNGSKKVAQAIPAGQDAIVTFHFRHRDWHMDKQEIHMLRLKLPQKSLNPGELLDLTSCPGWKNPTQGALGSCFHIRKKWGNPNLNATIRFINRQESTEAALAKHGKRIWSEEILRMTF